jgi:hypothetical protein
VLSRRFEAARRPGCYLRIRQPGTRAAFHRNDRDTTAMIAEWRSKLFGTEGELTDLLAS